MENATIATAPTIEEAIEKALSELGVEREEVEVEVLEEPTKKLFSGSTDAKVKVFMKPTSVEDIYNKAEEEGYEDEDEDETDYEDDEEIEEGFVAEDAEEDAALSDDDEKNYNEALKQLSEEELDEIADNAIETIRSFLVYFGAEEAEIDEYEGEEGELILDIVGENLAVLIGRHGKTLEAMQFLVSSIVSKKTGYRHPVVVDVKGYRHRRKQKIIGIAKASAARAIRQKHEVKLRPMTPYERRIVHIALKDDKRVVTTSEGVEPNRYIVIQLT